MDIQQSTQTIDTTINNKAAAVFVFVPGWTHDNQHNNQIIGPRPYSYLCPGRIVLVLRPYTRHITHNNQLMPQQPYLYSWHGHVRIRAWSYLEK